MRKIILEEWLSLDGFAAGKNDDFCETVYTYIGNKMTPYKSKSGKSSGVTAYEIGEDYIRVQFNFTETYTYTYKTVDEKTIEHMKSLANARKGLSTFISQNQPGYL